MNTQCDKFVWAIYLVGFKDDPAESNEAKVEPYIGKECVPVSGGRPEQAWYDVRLAVLARGGHLLTIAAAADEAEAEQIRQSAEFAILKPK